MEICDGCNAKIKQGEIRYVLNISVTADDGGEGEEEPLSDIDLENLMLQLENADSGDLTRQIYVERSFILCGKCRSTFIKNPLGQAGDCSHGRAGLNDLLH